MAKTVGDYFWERLSAWGVKRVFGYPGEAFASTLIDGDPSEFKIIKESAKEILEDFFTR